MMKKKRWVKPKVKEVEIKEENRLVFQACGKENCYVGCPEFPGTCNNLT